MSQVKHVGAVGSSNVDIETKFDDQNGEGTVKARLYFADGTDAEVKISKYNGEKLLGGSHINDGSSNNTIGANVLKGMSGLVTYSKLATTPTTSRGSSLLMLAAMR